MFERFHTTEGSRGSLAEVWIDKDAGLCKKYYKQDGLTIAGGRPYHQDLARIRELFENEIKWSLRCQGPHVVALHEYGKLEGDSGYYLTQDYHGPDLLQLARQHGPLINMVPDLIEQMESMFDLFRTVGLYKWNNAMSNLTLASNKIKAFDFKYAVDRSPENKDYERHTLTTWISKLDPRLPNILEKYL